MQYLSSLILKPFIKRGWYSCLRAKEMTCAQDLHFYIVASDVDSVLGSHALVSPEELVRYAGFQDLDLILNMETQYEKALESRIHYWPDQLCLLFFM